MPADQTVVEAFTELAPSYEVTMERELRQFWGLTYQQFLARLVGMAQLREGDVALDVATGTAVIPAQIAPEIGATGRVFGLDLTLAMLQHARTRLQTAGLSSRSGLVCASGMEMPLADAAFDVVICGLGTHHMHVPQLLSEMQRVLRPGGRLVLVDAAATRFWRSPFGKAMLRVLLVFYGLAMRSARARAEMEAFDNLRTADEWHALLTAHGFIELELSELSARHRWYPGGVILKAVRPCNRS